MSAWWGAWRLGVRRVSGQRSAIDRDRSAARSNADCLQLTAEIQANNLRFKELADEQGLKTGQNVAAGVAGLVIWPLWFAMVTTLAAAKCAQPAPPARQRRGA